MIQAADLEQMNLEEQLQAMELLSAWLSRRPNAVPSPDWHVTFLPNGWPRLSAAKRRLISVRRVAAEELGLPQSVRPGERG